MARTGGTLFGRCLACMQSVVLLSEIHPRGTRTYNPLDQADRWYGLLTQDDIRWAQNARPDFIEAIALIEKRCRQSGRLLVIRDWSHLDYTGVPFMHPTYRSGLVQALQSRFRIRRYATVRHPLDQWISLTKNQVIRERLDPDRYITGFIHFAKMAQEVGFVRYEDFTRTPDPVLKTLCKGLDLEFDAAYSSRWQSYENITGDVLPGRAGQEIRQLPRQDTDTITTGRLRALPGYHRALEALGYAEDEGSG